MLLPTRENLILAAIDLFGRNGFDGTSTRAIAARAGANIAGIAYHFGSKAGLRLACADYIAELAGQRLVPLLPDAEISALTPEQAETRLGAVLDLLVGFIVADPRGERFARFMIREQMDLSPAFERVFTAFIAPMHRRACRLWAAATGQDADSEMTALRVFSFVGQIVYFRVGRQVVLRRLGWETIGMEEAVRIAAVARRNLVAAIAAERRDRPDGARS
ncbi:MAG: CerR family C-terminal domain-containing protein [Hyphomicrobiales bacterium]|nr:CerR family C-terminal domain-containing protein [Hyphomicrobiales bacterium]MCA1998608.1 CerR family C-terminal domain-containing protein [Hyphomicrobiales bacterium]